MFCATSITYTKFFYSFVCMDLISLQFSFHRNQSTELFYSHTHFKVPSTTSAMHSVLIPLFHFFNKILYSNKCRGAKQELQHCDKGELQF